MISPYQKCTELSLAKGNVKICSFCSPDYIAGLCLQKTFIEYPRYNPIITKIESLVAAAKKPDANVTLAIICDNQIIGFAILKYPAPYERWIRVGENIMMEVAVVEVSRAFRSMGISKKLLEFVTDHPLKEDKIFYMVGYSWTWDLEEAGGTVMEYRNMMIRLFSRFGFKVFQTNEHNIMMRPENLFMARFGANIPESIIKKFKMVLFNLDL